MNRHLLFLIATLLLCLSNKQAAAQEIPIRYVKMTADGGAYTNDGTSWEQAKNNIQDAINDLKDYMQDHNLEEGHVYVTAGTYSPSESTESSQDGIAYTSFKIYEGITLYGGFDPQNPETKPNERKMQTVAEGYYYGWKLEKASVLDGNHTGNDVVNLVWNEKKQQFSTTFLGNSYHVVWFATNGFSPDGHAHGLNRPAGLDGFTIRGGYASNRTVQTREANSYGGGAYLVGNSFLHNCIVTGNVSTREGGAVYLDGGGELDHCYIRYNQCLGVGIVDGLGGGVAVYGAGVVRHTVMAENVARLGGGLALIAEKETTGNRYAPAAAGSIVANNTSTAEAGGVYLQYGGTLNHMTVVNNQCNGTNIIYDGRRYGRSAGIYINQYGEIFNTVCWGGKVEANADIQYAAYTEANQKEHPFVHYSAFAQNEITDWSATTRMNVISLNNKNEDYENDGNYPEFINPTLRLADKTIEQFTGVGIAERIGELTETDPDFSFTPLWQPYRNSVLRGQGVMFKDYDYVIDRWETLKQAAIEEDIQGTDFSPKTALGAYVTRSENITPEEMTVDGTVYQTIYVDPSRNSSKSIHHDQQDLHVGNSWDNPIGSLNDALLYFNYYPPQDGKKGRILVKEGTLTTRGNYMTGRLRSSSFIMVSNVEVYGGYPESLTGHDENERNPLKYPTHVTGDLAGGKYDNNVHHLVRFGDVENVVFDGFRLYAGNAASTAISTASSRHGGGVIVYTEEAGKSCRNNVLRNCIIANCTAMQGAAIYVTGLGTNWETDAHREVSLTVENCIIHNNSSLHETIPSAICARGSKTTLTLNHCTVRGNVGYGVTATESAHVMMNNSVIHANADTMTDDIATLATDEGKVRTLYTNGTGTITGDYNLLDAGTTVLPTATVGGSNQAVLTCVSSSPNYPQFVNPTRNVGHSEEVDNTIYGGYPNFMPTNISPLVNAANTTSIGDTDITCTYIRNYGGLPDVGAVENTDLPEGGKVLYVTPEGRGTKDGSSWANAIAGNTIYNLTNGTRVVENQTDVLTTDTRYCGSNGNYYYHANYRPYAETSNHSKPFWGTNITDTNANGANNANTHAITNTRREIYVSGLQYAVEKAAASDGNITEVWAGNGTYTDWKGYVIRDKVTVYGGFPASTISNPGMKERKPLLSESIPASDENRTLSKTDYETIIQVRNTNSTENMPTGMRKYVLYQPDVCLTTRSPNSEYGGNDNQSNTYRYNSASEGYVEYTGALWDGFTIRHGFINGLQNNRDGGAGVRMFRGVTLKNCVVKDNYNNANRSRGGGIYCDDGDGTSSAVINCFVINNNLYGNSDAYGGGMYMIVGTSYNSLFFNNYAQTQGGGIFLECATFYNNTIANNRSNGTGGMHHWIDGGRASKLAVYNCLFYKNSGAAVGSENAGDLEPFYNCYVQTEENLAAGVSAKITAQNHNLSGTSLANPFADDNYAATLNLRLADASACVNAGMNEPNAITLPDTDVDFATRIQDCTVDIGAYEYNGAEAIAPGAETAIPDAAIYYVTQNGRGSATATDPANAACWMKLQKVLDAAGRYKFQYPEKQVVVKLAAFPAGGDAGYMPRRSSVTETGNPDAENPRSYSIMVPRGVEVWGGYTDTWTNENSHGFLETNRDITANRTTLTGLYQSEGQDVNVYHVVTFTDRTFDADGRVRAESLADKAAGMGIHNKAILDGLFITEGLADGVKTENQRGGAAVLPEYAHVRNCIVHTNEASEEGGALYMQPRSLVSGTLLVNNRSGGRGGAIFVEEPVASQDMPNAEGTGTGETFARIFTSTIVLNSAKEGGGIDFQTNLRANSIVLWNNSAHSHVNISGQLDPFSTRPSSSQTINDYPLSFSAVENMHAAGINNLQLHPQEQKGVRFAEDGLYGLTPTSVLVRAGMRYEDYRTFQEEIPTLAPKDFTGVGRTAYENDYIDIGARAIDLLIHATAGADNLLTRLYVVSPELDIDLDLQKTLMNSTDARYKQPGSSFANPMIRLDDALDYIRKARKAEIAGVKDIPFEIFVSRGTFYPLRTIRGAYSYSRANTYLVPEGVSIIGGMKTQTEGRVTFYGQETSGTEDIGGSAGWENKTSPQYRKAWLESLEAVKDNNEFRKDSQTPVTGDKAGYWATAPLATTTSDQNSGDLNIGNDRNLNPELTEVIWNDSTSFTVHFTYKGNNEGTFSVNGIDGDYVEIVGFNRTNTIRKYWYFTYRVYKYTYYHHREYTTTPGFVTIAGATTDEIRASRLHYDLNNNGIIEPWEMKEQTILSGANVNSTGSENVYHVIAAIPAKQWVGELPGTSTITGKTKEELEAATLNGTRHAEQGARIILDGLYISDGHAHGYEPDFVGSQHTYYKGGGICVDGNWVTTDTGTDGPQDMFLNTGVHNPLGYRNIPLTVANCQFSNNIGGMGGAIFSNGDLEVYGCSFTQNYSMGGEDRENTTPVARYTGNGGAMNVSGMVIAVNSLFANNEAQKGGYTPLADDTQKTGGWGGAILAGEHSRLHVLNCNFVRNKATNYPAIYNYVSNQGWLIDDTDYSPEGQNGAAFDGKAVRLGNPHRVVNTIFWGNEAEGIHKAINFGPEGHEQEHLWFCAYGANCGLTPVVVPPTDEFDYRKIAFHFHEDDDGVKRAAYIPALFQHYHTEKMGADTGQNARPAPWQVTGNIILNAENTALDGPNFINPSLTAGIEGYMASADWMVSRINNLVDNGWTHLEQHTDGTYPEPLTSLNGNGVYKTVADESKMRHDNFTLMPYGNEEFMYYPEITDEASGKHRQMLRISNDPNPTQGQTFIDIGLYEYQHIRLNPESEGLVDILWVTQTERQDISGPADGSDWLHATSDLQRAIETLLSGRNGHDKEIRMLEGTYTPVYTIGGNLGFKISTKNADGIALVEDGAKTAEGIKSLTIRGGYSKESAGPYDYEKYPVTLCASARAGVSEENLKHLFFIEDARQRTSLQSGSSIITTEKDYVIPITLYGLGFSGETSPDGTTPVGVTALYYADQLTEELQPLTAPNGGKRLTIYGCKFRQSGDPEKAAVHIGRGGGDALFANSLFHSNKGKPLQGTDTKVINCTFALNQEILSLENSMPGFESELHNSVLWKNNREGLHASETASLSPGVVYTHNAISGILRNEETANDPLSDTNNDILNGPNFADPENPDVSLRNFHIGPSATLLTQASEELYARKILGLPEGQRPEIYKEAVCETTDLGFSKPRSFGSGLDRGAYECQDSPARIIYVDPNKTGNTGDGRSWENAYESGRLQHAVDAASVYIQIEAGNEDASAYVFVKGKREGHTGEALTLRHGVQIYGSIDPGYTVMAEPTAGGGEITTADISRYEQQMLKDRPGLAATGTYRTIVGSITADADTYTLRTLADGFVVTSLSPTTSPVLNLAAPPQDVTGSLAVRGCIVSGNQVKGKDTPVLNLANGLVYNTLVQENTTEAEADVSIGHACRMVNCTVVSSGTGKSAVTASGDIPLVMNSITYNITDRSIARPTGAGFTHACNTASGSPFAPYLAPTVGGYHAGKPAHKVANHYLWYQLHEAAPDLESADEDVTDLLPEALRPFIHLPSDRDILGNPRKLSSVTDRGCFETWHIKGSVITENEEMVTDDFHPADGSVVYIREEASLRLDGGMKKTFRPAYLLVAPGGSLYGNGARVEADFLAVERDFQAAYNLTAMPFGFRPADATFVTYPADGSLSEEVPVIETYTYDGSTRARPSHRFAAEDSPCWVPLSASETVSPGQGILTYGGSGRIRFTACSPTAGTYLYTEGGSETHKTVALNAYLETPPTGAGFTTAEDMGWNLTGCPYLVTDYITGAESGAGTGYAMNIPHICYRMTSEGGYDTFRSWDEGSTLGPVGSAFFTQTAALGPSELLRFLRPTYPGDGNRSAETRTLLVVHSDAVGSDRLVLCQPSADDVSSASSGYLPGRDGLKLMPPEEVRLPGLYARTSSGTALSLLGHIPAPGHDIPLGLYVPVPDRTYTFSLQNKECLNSCGAVWLTDELRGTVCNLLTEEYTFTPAPGTDHYADRFKLRIGGSRPVPTPHRPDYSASGSHSLRFQDGYLHLQGLTPGEPIRIYTTSGVPVFSLRATASDLRIPLPAAVYIVCIGAYIYKI